MAAKVASASAILSIKNLSRFQVAAKRAVAVRVGGQDAHRLVGGDEGALPRDDSGEVCLKNGKFLGQRGMVRATQVCRSQGFSARARRPC